MLNFLLQGFISHKEHVFLGKVYCYIYHKLTSFQLFIFYCALKPFLNLIFPNKINSYIESNQRHVDQLWAKAKVVKKMINRQKVLWADVRALSDEE